MANARSIIQGFNKFLDGIETIRASYGALKVLSLEHERVHAGKSFRHSEVHSLAAAGVYNHLIIPTSGSDLHLQSMTIKADGGIVHLGLYEAPFYDVNSLGTDDIGEWFNQNRRSSNTAPMATYETAFIDANSLGARISEDLITDVSKDAGGAEEGIPSEIVLSSVKAYLLRVRNDSGGIIATVAKFTVYDATEY